MSSRSRVSFEGVGSGGGYDEVPSSYSPSGSRGPSIDIPRSDLLAVPAQPEEHPFSWCRHWSYHTRKRMFYALFAVLGIVLLALFAVSIYFLVDKQPGNNSNQSETTQIRNVILLIGDGMGPAVITMGREFAGLLAHKPFTPLALDPYLIATARTNSYSSRVTDSAAGATAMACGTKTANKMVAMDPRSLTPLRTLIEAAIDAGLKTGVVTTDALYGATPASFTAHATDRGMYAQIAAQQMKLPVDIMLGGGKSYYGPMFNGSNPRSINLITTQQELQNANALPLWGFFRKRANGLHGRPCQQSKLSTADPLSNDSQGDQPPPRKHPKLKSAGIPTRRRRCIDRRL